MAKLPKLTDGTVVCLASGPSLTEDDVNYVRGKAVVIAVNDTIRWAPWADVIYSSDQLWWSRHHREVKKLQLQSHSLFTRPLAVRINPKKGQMGPTGKNHCSGCRRILAPNARCWCEGIVTLENAGPIGLSLKPDTICYGDNSGYAAINVAVHLGATRILLLGYDMGPDPKGRRHFYDTHAQTITSPFYKFRKRFATIVEPLKEVGVEVINCSRRTALDAFPTAKLRDVL